ncbi:MAG: L7Ae/L30e/S12e/Gadd45 family ribosomal protein [Huintestinicola sp.]
MNSSNNEKIINLLTMCRKAGRVQMGFDSAKESLAEKKAKLILTASDISPKTEKEIRFFAEKSGTEVIGLALTIEELGFGIGKKVGILAVCDEGFSKKLRELSSSEE